MARWTKLVAIFLLGFTLYDVSVAETCIDEALAIAGQTTQVQPSNQDDDRGTCQFEEDCLACAHILPGSHYVLSVTTVVSLGESDIVLPTQGGIPLLPYHPPRA
jgi:hypothetical protein